MITCYCVRSWVSGRYGGNLARCVRQTRVRLRSVGDKQIITSNSKLDIFHECRIE